eukprot:jgi/Mesvir1/3149/Mv16314-RA.1
MTREGALFTWGANTKGQLGVGQTGSQLSPVQIQGAVTGIEFVRMAAGGAHSLAVSKSGEIYCWGSNEFGQLGLGDLEDRFTPHVVRHRFSKSRIVRVDCGHKHSMALTADGNVFTWGNGECGQLGYDVRGNRPYVAYPRHVETLKAVRIIAGYAMSIATITSGKMFVWGCSKHGELGIGDTTTRKAPHILPSQETNPYTAISAGANHVLASKKKGELFGWGMNTQGQLGLSFLSPVELMPRLIASAASTDVVLVATGGHFFEYQGHSLAVTAAGKVYTWGWNAFGQTGLGTLDAGSPTPSRLFSLEDPVQLSDISCGQYNTLAIAKKSKTSSAVYSWGPNYHGQLGHSFLNLGPVLQPTRVEALRYLNIVQVAVGYSHVLALTADGILHVWGSNVFGQLGTGDSKDRTKPTVLNAFRQARVESIAAGMHSSFAITAEPEPHVYAWGFNDNFELGLGEGIARNSPQIIHGLEGRNITMLAPGGYHVLAASSSGEVYAWGSNFYGQLGLGYKGDAVSTPQKVELPAALRISLPDTDMSLAGKRRTRPLGAGSWHSVAVSSDGSVYTWGRNSHGQLGHDEAGDKGFCPSPKPVSSIEDSEAVGVAVAASHTLVAALPGPRWVA